MNSKQSIQQLIFLALEVLFFSSCGRSGFEGSHLQQSSHRKSEKPLTSEDKCELPRLDNLTDQVNTIRLNHSVGPSGVRLRLEVENLYRRQLGLLPPVVLKLIEKNKIRYALVDGPVSDFGLSTFRSGTVYPNWNKVVGAHLNGMVYLGDETRFSSGARSILVHETAHAVMQAMSSCEEKGPCKLAKLGGIYDQDTFAAPETTTQDSLTAYRLSRVEEHFAVGFDEYYCSAKTRKNLQRNYSNLFDLIEGLEESDFKGL